MAAEEDRFWLPSVGPVIFQLAANDRTVDAIITMVVLHRKFFAMARAGLPDKFDNKAPDQLA